MAALDPPRRRVPDMRRPARLLALLALSPVVAFAGDPCPIAPKAPDDLDARIDAALAASAAERAAHAARLAADGPAAIARLLDRLKPAAVPAEPVAASSRGLTLDVRFVTATEESLRGAVDLPSETIGLFRTLESAQVDKLLDQVEHGEAITQYRAAQLTLYDRQRATAQVVNQLSYISDFEVEVAQDSFIADPVVATLAEGLLLDLRPVLSADGAFVTLETEVKALSVARPIAVEEVALAAGKTTTKVQVQRPETHSAEVKRTITVPLGAHVLWRAPRPDSVGANEKPVWLLVTATAAELSAGPDVRTEEPAPPEPAEVIQPKTDGESPPELPPPGK
jgi:hypothetical protein